MPNESDFKSILSPKDLLSPIEHAKLLQDEAAHVGFDWPNVLEVLDKLEEEMHEIKAALEIPDAKEALFEEFGDIFFVLINIARHLDISPLEALEATNRKFSRRFQFIEKTLHDSHQTLEATSLNQLEKLWQKAKDTK